MFTRDGGCAIGGKLGVHATMEEDLSQIKKNNVSLSPMVSKPTACTASRVTG